MDIGIKIKRLRENQKISQTELSAILGISQTKLCHIESSEDKSIDFVLMTKICRYFKLEFDYFLEEKKEIDWQTHFPESIIAQINSLIVDNKFKEKQIKELLAQIEELKANQS